MHEDTYARGGRIVQPFMLLLVTDKLCAILDQEPRAAELGELKSQLIAIWPTKPK
jgi:hypothetical protein